MRAECFSLKQGENVFTYSIQKKCIDAQVQYLSAVQIKPGDSDIVFCGMSID